MSDPVPEQPWGRLDPRMLLVHPVREVVRFLPALVALLLAGPSGGGVPWEALGVLVPVGLGVLRYLTTSYRLSPARVELRSGLLNRHVLSTPVDRVRTVDLSASLVHRALGLSTVRIGTGTTSTRDDQDLRLDGLRAADARVLRDRLLHVAHAEHAADPQPATGAQEPDAGPVAARPGAPAPPVPPVPPAPPAPPVLTLDPAWARYAPLTSTGLVVLAGLFGAGTQLANDVPGLEPPDPSSLSGLSVWLGVAVLLGLALLAMTVLAVGGYLVTNWGFTLTHRDGAWHLVRGLLTTRETSLDDERLAGVTLHEPLSLRVAGAGRLSAIVTGLRATESTSALLVPPAPRPAVEQVAAAVLDSGDAPRTPLRPHGPAAVRRRYVRAVVPALVLAVALVLVPVLTPLSASWAVLAVLPVPVAVALAVDRARSLGHAVVEGHLVARAGSITRHRDVLDVDHVIGWNLRSTWFQRRVGLTTATATTAGGRQYVEVLDVPKEDAVALAGATLPAVVAQFAEPRAVSG